MSDNAAIKSDESLDVKVVFFSTLRNIAGQDSISLQFPKNTTIRTILQNVQKKYFLPSDHRILKAGDEALDVGNICLIDDVDLNLTGGMRFKLRNSVTITLISSLHGG
ncbi:MAG: hypothetical protein ACTSVL_12700 [Promethearchaeota archaeon]